jgi:hypothetical protein
MQGSLSIERMCYLAQVSRELATHNINGYY